MSLKIQNKKLNKNIQQKDIDDFNLSDDRIIENLQELNLSKQYRNKIIEIKNGPEEFNLLHSAAKQCRAKVCSVLINEFKFGINLKNLFSFFVKN